MDNTNIYLLIVVVILTTLISNYFLNKNKRELERENNKNSIRPEMSEKNKWIFPTDGFGKMEKDTQR